jgi:hypothetical protein
MKLGITRKLVLAMGCVRLISAQTNVDSTLGIQWQEVAGNPAIVGSACISWMCAGVTDPTLTQDKTGKITLWFTTAGIAQGASANTLVASGPYTGQAAGTLPPGAVSTTTNAAVIPVGPAGVWDQYVETPTVRYKPGSSTPTMWYLGYAAPGFVSPAIGQMTAKDTAGKNWNRAATPIYRPSPNGWDGNLVTGPTVVIGPDGIWRLYYTGLGTKDGVGLLTSTDGNNWTPYTGNPVLEAEPNGWDNQILEQCVVYLNGKYWMWYSGFEGPLGNSTSISIGLATSTDGVNWTRYSGNPVIKPGASGSWDDLRVVAPDVIVEPDGSLLMAAYGQSQSDIGKTAGAIGFWRSH